MINFKPKPIWQQTFNAEKLQKISPMTEGQFEQRVTEKVEKTREEFRQLAELDSAQTRKDLTRNTIFFHDTEFRPGKEPFDDFSEMVDSTLTDHVLMQKYIKTWANQNGFLLFGATVFMAESMAPNGSVSSENHTVVPKLGKRRATFKKTGPTEIKFTENFAIDSFAVVPTEGDLREKTPKTNSQIASVTLESTIKIKDGRLVHELTGLSIKAFDPLADELFKDKVSFIKRIIGRVKSHFYSLSNSFTKMILQKDKPREKPDLFKNPVEFFKQKSKSAAKHIASPLLKSELIKERLDFFTEKFQKANVLFQQYEGAKDRLKLYGKAPELLQKDYKGSYDPKNDRELMRKLHTYLEKNHEELNSMLDQLDQTIVSSRIPQEYRIIISSYSKEKMEENQERFYSEEKIEGEEEKPHLSK